MYLCSSEDCTGCMACVNTCSQNAIGIRNSEEGFQQPIIKNELCVNCGLCNKVCPVVQPQCREQFDFLQYGYACWAKDEEIRRNSSSGGLFTVLAEKIIEKEGIVYGAAFDADFRVKHIGVEKKEDLELLRRSKYVQSDIGHIFKDIKATLKNGRLVYFVGTPCQVAGLKSFLGKKKYSNLITSDFVCHGVPSPAVFEAYKDWLKKTHDAKITSFSFRDKHKSWLWFNFRVEFENSNTYIGKWHEDPYLRIFLADNVLRNSCYTCFYTNMERISDITIADFWGYKAHMKKEKNDDKGISLALINSEKGEELFNSAKSSLFSFKRTKEEIAKSQKSLSSAWDKPTVRDEFWTDFKEMSFDVFIDKWAKPRKRNLSQWIISEYGKNTFTSMVVWIYNKYDGLKRRINLIWKR